MGFNMDDSFAKENPGCIHCPNGGYVHRMSIRFLVGSTINPFFLTQGEIGVLDRRDMDNFAAIFLNFQNLGKCHDDANS